MVIKIRDGARRRILNRKLTVNPSLSRSSGYIGEFEIIDDHRGGKVVIQLSVDASELIPSAGASVLLSTVRAGGSGCRADG